MNKLTKKYKVIFDKNGKLLFDVTKENYSIVYPSVDVTSVEFDTYAEAKSYVDEHGLVYEEPKFGEQM